MHNYKSVNFRSKLNASTYHYRSMTFKKEVYSVATVTAEQHKYYISCELSIYVCVSIGALSKNCKESWYLIVQLVYATQPNLSPTTMHVYLFLSCLEGVAHWCLEDFVHYIKKK